MNAVISTIVPLGLLMGSANASWAAAPDWLRTLVPAQLPEYPAKTNAVILLDERIITVKDSGEIKTNRRMAVKILRPEGKNWGVFRVNFDNDTRLTFMKAWSFPAGQPEFEMKEKDAVETGYSGDSLYSDVRYKTLSVPAAEPGTVAGFEYEQKDRPFLLQHVWGFQRTVPVRKARLVLQLPPGWEFKPVWRNFVSKQPAAGAGNQWTWELENVPAIEAETLMPAWGALAGQMSVNYLARGPDIPSHANWNDVAAWYRSLASSRLLMTPEVARKTAEVVGSAATTGKKIEILATFVQRKIRYVSIPIGISSHQPHAAAEVMAKGYGDCKDKATLLKAMLKEVGVESYYVLVHSDRSSVNPEFASVLNFNHVILAIRAPAEMQGIVFAQVKHATIGNLILFDPTDQLTPFGNLPDSLQSSDGLMVLEDKGELLRLPLLSSGACRLIRLANLKLLADGSLTGAVKETRVGRFAAEMRTAYRRAEGTSQGKILEGFLGASLGDFQLTSGSIENLDGLSDVVLTYLFTAPNYGKSTGSKLLLRPRVLGLKGMLLGEKKDRQHPVSLSSPSSELEAFEIELPAGYEIDELPVPANADYPFARYTSTIKLEGNKLRYDRTYLTKQVEIPKENFADLWNLQRLISADEHSYVVLRKKSTN